jgi:hypothetical protein
MCRAAAGRDVALRCLRPRSAGGTNTGGCADTLRVAPLNAARTAQRAIPTNKVVPDTFSRTPLEAKRLKLDLPDGKPGWSRG